jgi:hypothetical protein
MYDSMKDKTTVFHEVVKWAPFETKKKERKPNSLYVDAPRPAWCVKKFGKKERTPEFRCLCQGKGKQCPFLCFTEADKSDYDLFNKIWMDEEKL